MNNKQMILKFKYLKSIKRFKANIIKIHWIVKHDNETNINVYKKEYRPIQTFKIKISNAINGQRLGKIIHLKEDIKVN